jgi:hypothetical protein
VTQGAFDQDPLSGFGGSADADGASSDVLQYVNRARATHGEEPLTRGPSFDEEPCPEDLALIDRLGEECFPARPGHVRPVLSPHKEQRRLNEHSKSSNPHRGVNALSLKSALYAEAPAHSQRPEVARSTGGRAALRKELAALDGDEQVAFSVIAAGADYRGETFEPRLGSHRCFLPGHAGMAEITRTKKGLVRYECDDNLAHGHIRIGPVDVYASCVAGRFLGSLNSPSLVRWRCRALGEVGYLTLVPVALLPLPAESPGSVCTVWKGVGLLRSVEATIGDDPSGPFAYTVSFASAWCGLPSRTAADGIDWLRTHDLLRMVGKSPGRPKPMPLYALPGL